MDLRAPSWRDTQNEKKNFQNLDSSRINKNRIYIQNEKPPKLDHQTGMPYPPLPLRNMSKNSFVLVGLPFPIFKRPVVFICCRTVSLHQAGDLTCWIAIFRFFRFGEGSGLNAGNVLCSQTRDLQQQVCATMCEADAAQVRSMIPAAAGIKSQ